MFPSHHYARSEYSVGVTDAAFNSLTQSDVLSNAIMQFADVFTLFRLRTNCVSRARGGRHFTYAHNIAGYFLYGWLTAQ